MTHPLNGEARRGLLSFPPLPAGSPLYYLSDVCNLSPDLSHWWLTRPWNTWLDSANKLTQILVALGGGLAAFRKFGVKAELSISGRLFEREGNRYLIITAGWKNTGAVRLRPKQRGTGIFISVLDDTSTNESGQVSWVNLTVIPVFERHQWIVPSETIEEVTTLKMPPDSIAVQLRLRT